MKLATQTPKKVLKAFLKQKPLRSEIDLFKTNLIALLDKMKTVERQPKDETEEHLKNDLRDFLRDTYYRDTHSINTKDKKDLVVHLGKGTDSEVGVIIEAKRPSNTAEMVTADNPNKKALHELILYYFDERNGAGNNQLKHLIVTNVQEWYILDANLFDKHVYRNTQLKKLYDTKRNDKKDNPWFYEEVSKVIAKMDVDLPCTYFDIREYDAILRNNKKEDDRELSALYKILSPQHLLKIASPNDSNALNEKFYKELLHLIGLEEAKEGGKNIIRRKKDGENPASLIELTIDALKTEDVLHRLPDASIYGASKEERIFNVALELCITWINRILFLKLLEGQLVSYHQGNRDYRFLNSGMIHDFDELFKLFHKVLAVNVQERTAAIQEKYGRVPYLNSSLFEISELEDQTIKINALDNGLQLDLLGASVLKDLRKQSDKLPTLSYLFEFLDAYDFASEGTEDVQEENKSIINASVLGKVFEKINGYKDGSIFTPAFITMYMCRQSIRLAVVEKFNESLGAGTFERYEDLKNYTARMFKTQDILKANEVINAMRICDPAVGSGHFLVSSLNEIICIKAELGILADKEGNSISGYEIEIINDELIITDPRNRDSTLEYKMSGGKPVSKEAQRLQKLLFHEKQAIIENCLFGVDINPNSVKICRLRLWIELLKNAYYREESNFTELETLPNIDINIKCGNSLLSRFALDADLGKALKSIKYDIKAYRGFVQDYKNEKSRDVKRGLQKIIDGIKSDFRMEIGKNDPKQLRLYKLSGELYNLLQPQMFELSAKEKKANKEKQVKLEAEIQKLATEIEEIKSNAIYKNAFEWRFEFPEVLNNAGEFEGFDVVIGNPPYFSLAKIKEHAVYFESKYQTYSKGSDIYCLFYERGSHLLKKDGILTYITSNSWLRSIYGELLKKFIRDNTQPILLLNIEDVQIFKEATVESNVLTFQKKILTSPFEVCNLGEDYVLGSSLSTYFEEKAYSFVMPDGDNWSIGDEKTTSLKAKIEGGSMLLKEFNIVINFGIKTGFNEAFIIDAQKRAELIAQDAKNAEIIKPILRGRDLKKYNHEFAGVYAICTFPSLKIEINDFPFLKQHFEFFGRSRLEQSGHPGCRKKTSQKWFETQDSIGYWKDFEKPKIVWGEISDKPKFSYDEEHYYAEATTFLMTGERLKYLLGILNSKVSEWYFNQISTTTGMGTNRWKKYKIELLPIKIPSPEQESQIETLVTQILAQKQRGEDTTALEREVDRLVYGLYGLTEEEIRVVEGAEPA